MQEVSLRALVLLRSLGRSLEERLSSERGAVSIEYVGIVAFVGVLVGAILLAAPTFASSLVGKITTVITSIVNGGGG